MRKIEPEKYIGKRSGALVVEALVGFGERGGKRLPVYRCRCDCGGSINMIHARLFQKNQSKVSACDACRFTRTCITCGKNFISQSKKTTCSDECRTQIRRARDMESYFRRIAKNPNHNKERYIARKKAASENPAIALRMAESERKSRARKKERFLSLPIEEQLRIKERDRARSRAFYYENHARIRSAANERRCANREEVNAQHRILWRKRKTKQAEKELIELKEKIEKMAED